MSAKLLETTPQDYVTTLAERLSSSFKYAIVRTEGDNPVLRIPPLENLPVELQDGSPALAEYNNLVAKYGLAVVYVVGGSGLRG